MGRSYGGSRLVTMVALALLATLVVMLPQVSAKRFIVGGNMGWTSNVDYTLWAQNQIFYVGDWLYFVYDRNQNDVLEVTKTNYETCNTDDPVQNYTTGAGRDVVPLNVTHDRYFISSKGWCYAGMRIHIHLTPTPPPPGAAPSKNDSRISTVPTPLPPPPTVAPSESDSRIATVLSPLPPPPTVAPSESDSRIATVLSPLPPPPTVAPSKSDSPIFSPLPTPPSAAPSKSDSPRYTVLRSQIMISAIVTFAAIWV